MMEPHSEQSGASSGMGRNGSSWCGPASVARRLLRQVEEARIVENHKWIAFYDAQYALEKARWNVLRFMGEVEASVEALPDTAR
jgi:hypothetical protein